MSWLSSDGNIWPIASLSLGYPPLPSGGLLGVKISQVVYLSNLNINSNFTLFLLLS